MRIGIDFDNTIICYDQVFCDVAKAWQLVKPEFQGSKNQLRDTIQASPVGDIGWQRLQGKVYGEFIQAAFPFSGFKDFIATCNNTAIEVFIVSHKTEFGHFDEKRINLRDASRQWLERQGFFNGSFSIKEANIFFETTREEKIERIKSLQCTHFIDDLIEVLDSPLFPQNIERILFQTQTAEQKDPGQLKTFSNWADIKNAIFS